MMVPPAGRRDRSTTGGGRAGASLPSTPEVTSSPRLRHVLQNPPLYVWTCDNDLRVTEILHSSGYPEDDTDPKTYVGRGDVELYRPGEAEAFSALKRRALERRSTIREKFSCHWAGRVREFDMVIVPNFDDEEEPEGVTCIAVDITPGLDLLRTHSIEETQPAMRVQRSSQRSLPQVLRSLVGRMRTKPDLASSSVAAGDLVIDSKTHGLRGPDGVVTLTRTEWLLLQQFLENRDRVIPHETLLERIWGRGYENEVRLLHDTVSRLRHRFHQVGACTRCIQTVHGIGYRFTAE